VEILERRLYALAMSREGHRAANRVRFDRGNCMRNVPTLSHRLLAILVLLAGVVSFPALRVLSALPQQKLPKSQVELQRERVIPSLEGPDLFHAYCAPCHGQDGKGNGPVAPALKANPPDLTTIAQRNGGRFPVPRVRSIIAGDQVITAHGSREMPIWGPIFHQIEWDRDFGNIRLENLTKYLESIQRK
jgi:mono/diheme cytochrome c family protein